MNFPPVVAHLEFPPLVTRLDITSSSKLRKFYHNFGLVLVVSVISVPNFVLSVCNKNYDLLSVKVILDCTKGWRGGAED